MTLLKLYMSLANCDHLTFATNFTLWPLFCAQKIWCTMRLSVVFRFVSRLFPANCELGSAWILRPSFWSVRKMNALFCGPCHCDNLEHVVCDPFNLRPSLDSPHFEVEIAIYPAHDSKCGGTCHLRPLSFTTLFNVTQILCLSCAFSLAQHVIELSLATSYFCDHPNILYWFGKTLRSLFPGKTRLSVSMLHVFLSFGLLIR